MTPPDGYEVQPEALDEAARQLKAVAGELCGAREVLVSRGDLPTLDPLSKSMAIVAGIVGIPLIPIGHAVGRAISEAIDPYPPVRHAWEDALGRYCRMVGDDARGLHDTAEEYRYRERNTKDDLDPLYAEPVPIPTVPGRPTVPMPEADTDRDGPTSV